MPGGMQPFPGAAAFPGQAGFGAAPGFVSHFAQELFHSVENGKLNLVSSDFKIMDFKRYTS